MIVDRLLSSMKGIRQEVNSPYSIYEGLIKPDWGFPGGRSQLFRQGLQEVLGLSDEFLTKSVISSSDASILEKKLSVRRLKKVAARMEKISGRSFAMTTAKNGLSTTGFAGADRATKEIGFTGRQLRKIKKSGQEGVLIRYKADQDPKDVLATIMHELVEASEAIAWTKSTSRPITDVRPVFGSHVSPTVIAEESRLAVAMGNKEAQMSMRNTEYRNVYAYAGSHRNVPSAGSPAQLHNEEYAEGMARLGQISEDQLAVVAGWRKFHGEEGSVFTHKSSGTDYLDYRDSWYSAAEANNTIKQVANYTVPVAMKNLPPSMGVGIRAYETAIKHRARSKVRHRSCGRHCNGSRAYR